MLRVEVATVLQAAPDDRWTGAVTGYVSEKVLGPRSESKAAELWF